MSFDTCEQYDKGGLFVKLADHGETLQCVFLAEPEPIETITPRGQKRPQFLFPVLTNDGVQIFPANVTTFRKLRDNWKTVFGRACEIIREGKRNDQGTKYMIRTTDDPDDLLKAAGNVDQKEVTAALSKAIGGRNVDDNGEIPF